jgi:hypothetical protein
MSQIPEPASVPPPDVDVPAAVADLAASHSLGEVCACHGDPSPAVYALGAVIVGAGSFGLWGIVTWVGLGPLNWPVAILGLAGVVFALIGLLIAVKMAVTGRRICYLHEHGFVHRGNRRLRAVTWPEVSAIARNYAGERSSHGGFLDRYDVYLHDGTKIVLPVGKAGETAKPFESEVELAIARAGITTERALIPEILDQLEQSRRPDQSDPDTEPRPRPPETP